MEAVLDGAGLQDLGRGDDEAHALDAGLGGVVDAIGAADLKSLQVVEAAETALGVADFEVNFAILDLHALVLRTFGVKALHPVVAAQGHHGEALTDGALHAGMDLTDFVGAHEVIGADTADMGQPARDIPLGLTQEGGFVAGDVAVVEGTDFYLIEGEVALSPALTPSGDEIGQTVGILVVMADIGFALIPDEALERIALDGMDHTVVAHDGRIGLALAERGLVLLEIGVAAANLGGCPGLDSGAAPAGGNHADGYLQRVDERGAEEVADGTPGRHSRG